MRLINNLKRKLAPQDLGDLPSTSALQNKIKRVRRNDNNECENVDSIEYTLKGSLAMFGSENFVKFDNHGDKYRFTILSTKMLLKTLGKSKKFMIDGTFSIVPQFLTQLITIHGSIEMNGKTYFVPLVFILTNTKKKATYIQILQEVRNLVNRLTNSMWTPVLSYSDFEQSFVSSIRTVFPTAKIQLCNFHFCQSLWR